MARTNTSGPLDLPVAEAIADVFLSSEARMTARDVVAAFGKNPSINKNKINQVMYRIRDGRLPIGEPSRYLVSVGQNPPIWFLSKDPYMQESIPSVPRSETKTLLISEVTSLSSMLTEEQLRELKNIVLATVEANKNNAS